MKAAFVRRPPVLGVRGCAVSDQPVVSQIGIEILRKGGNSADACVAMMAALNVTQPFTCGLGGDAMCLFFRAQDGTVHGINGSGRSPSGLTYEALAQAGIVEKQDWPPPEGSALLVMVPGAPAAWEDIHRKFGSGKLTLKEVYQPAIDLARAGFAVSEVAALGYASSVDKLLLGGPHGGDLLVSTNRISDGTVQNKSFRPPTLGEVMKNAHLADSLEIIARKGSKEGFYRGRLGQAVVEAVEKAGGLLSQDDLYRHSSESVASDRLLSTTYKNRCRLWELPPNGDGIVALLSLGILEQLPGFHGMEVNSGEYLHFLIETFRLAFAKGFQVICDPEAPEASSIEDLKDLIKKDSNFIKMAVESISSKRRIPELSSILGEIPLAGLAGSTSYCTAVDSQGNACSLISSNCHGVGTGIVPERAGFSLQDRGCCFNFRRGHGNCVGPGKRSFHSIIPALVTTTDGSQLLASLGLMGLLMQPQGHVQALLNMVDFGMNPQQATNHPRLFVDFKTGVDNPIVRLEPEISREAREHLEALGHSVAQSEPDDLVARKSFGRLHVIAREELWNPNFRASKAGCGLCHRDNGFHASDGCLDDASCMIKDDGEVSWWAGCDPRTDGLALGWGQTVFEQDDRNGDEEMAIVNLSLFKNLKSDDSQESEQEQSQVGPQETMKHQILDFLLTLLGHDPITQTDTRVVLTQESPKPIDPRGCDSNTD